MSGLPAEVEAWLTAFAAAVRARDIASGAQLFSPACSAFGTRAERTHGLEDLIRLQWTPIWTTTADFSFHLETAEVLAAGDASLHVVLVQWSSNGVTADGSPKPRSGRATIVVVPDPRAPHGHLAVHTHFSESPQAPPAATSGSA